jgi:hypothetical protein
MGRSRREHAFTHRRGPIEGNPNWECLASGMGNRRCGGQFHSPSLDQAALRLLPEAAAVLVHIKAYASSHYSSRELQVRLVTRFD